MVTILLIGVIIYLYMKATIYLKMRMALVTALKYYPKNILMSCERIFDMETSHLTSFQFMQTWSPGMEVNPNNPDPPYYGWDSIIPFWKANPQYAPVGTYTMTESKGILNNGGKVKTFIKFPSLEASVMTICYKMQNNGNNPGAWYSSDPALQEKYTATLNQIIPRITNEITG
jgi:hypothetical protein